MAGSFRAVYAAVLAATCFVATYLSGRAELAVLGVLLLGFTALEVHGVQSRRARPERERAAQRDAAVQADD